MHMDIDAFFPSVEQSRMPFLRGKPVVVGSGVIASCSYEARRFGLHAGMAIHEAKKRCPQAVYLEGDAQVYRSFAEKIWEQCHTMSPAVDTYLDDAYLDMTGTHRLYPDVRTAAVYLKQRVREATGLSVTVGVGPSRVVARMAGAERKPDGLTVVEPAVVGAFLAEKPVRELVGVGRKIEHKMGLLGIRTVGQMRKLPLDGLEALFGRNGHTLYERCRGRDGRVVGKREIPRTISRETTFHRATADPAEVRSMLYYLTERGMRTVRQLGLKTRAVKLRICYSDWVARAAQRTVAATDLEGPVFERVMELMRTQHTRRVSLRRAGVVLSSFEISGGAQRTLFDDAADPRRERLALAVDAVRGRFGFKAVVAGPAVGLLGKLKWGEHGYVLRTPSLTK